MRRPARSQLLSQWGETTPALTSRGAGAAEAEEAHRFQAKIPGGEREREMGRDRVRERDGEREGDRGEIEKE